MKQYGNGRRLLGHEAVIREEVANRPDATLSELCERVADAGAPQVSPATMCVELQRLNLPGRKSRPVPARATLSPTNGAHPESDVVEMIEALKDVINVITLAIVSLERIHSRYNSLGINYYDEVRRFEIDLITRALKQTGGNQVKAARLLGLKKTTLHGKIKLYNIQ